MQARIYTGSGWVCMNWTAWRRHARHTTSYVRAPPTTCGLLCHDHRNVHVLIIMWLDDLTIGRPQGDLLRSTAHALRLSKSHDISSTPAHHTPCCMTFNLVAWPCTRYCAQICQDVVFESPETIAGKSVHFDH